TGQAPTPYVIEKYRAFHERVGIQAGSRFDQWLVAMSARGPGWTRLADSYATVFLRSSVVRRKLVLMLALLECAPPSSEALDRVPAGGRVWALVRLGGVA